MNISTWMILQPSIYYTGLSDFRERQGELGRFARIYLLDSLEQLSHTILFNV